MGGLGGADGEPGYHSPNIGDSVISKRIITEANGGSMPKVVRSSISHQKLDSRGGEEIIIYALSDPSVDPPRIVLAPKLRAPLPRPEHVVRRRLLELLRYALEFKVSVISAPTGYGKTTLLAHWRQVEETNLPFAWVSLDEQD